MSHTEQVRSLNGETVSPSTNANEWGKYKTILFRVAFIYFVLQALPIGWNFYGTLFSTDWAHLHFFTLLTLSRYTPQFFGLAGFANWLVVLVIAVLGAGVWTYYDRNKITQYTNLYYWLRVLLRYRLAVGIIAYGFIKLFPLQMPYPSLSSLHTDYGQLQPWKIYYHTIGITQWYESFLGGVEILAGLLLFFRRTATFGAGIAVGFIFNVLAANFAYSIGEQVYSVYLFVIALFLLAYDVPRLYSLLIEQRFTIAEKFNPPFKKAWLKQSRVALKAAFVLFILLFGYKTYSNYKNEPYLIPKTPALSGSYGFYNVKEFKLNNKPIPYSLTDTSRWQNVVFEKWATLSVKIAGTVKLDTTTGNAVHEDDIDRNYEEAGVGDRRYFTYKADTVSQTLLLANKNPNYKGDQLLLHYSRPDSTTILLTGVNENKDSVFIQLDKVVKKYMLFEGRRKPLKI